MKIVHMKFRKNLLFYFSYFVKKLSDNVCFVFTHFLPFFKWFSMPKNMGFFPLSSLIFPSIYGSFSWSMFAEQKIWQKIWLLLHWNARTIFTLKWKILPLITNIVKKYTFIFAIVVVWVEGKLLLIIHWILVYFRLITLFFSQFFRCFVLVIMLGVISGNCEDY